MRKYSFSTLLLMLAATAATSFGACHAVGPAAGGSGSGSDWNNRMGKLPTNLVRGDTYYLMDGSYGGYTFTTANSGTTRVTVKKAQSYDFGRAADGCSNDISAGWNAATMGSAQAGFSSFNGGSTQGYLTLDGNGSSTAAGCGTSPTTNTQPKDCGIKFTVSQGSTGPITIGQNGQRVAGWTIRYVETQGAGDGNNNGSTEENHVRCAGACDAFLVEHVWWYNSSCNSIKLPWTTSATFRDSYFKQNFSSSACHGQFYLSEVTTSNVTFADNVIQDIQGTGIWVVVTGGQADNYNIYNNVIVKTQGSSRAGVSNGIFACINSGSKCTNWKFIDNSIINFAGDYSGSAGILSENNNGNSYTWQNNLFYNSSGVGFTLNGAAFTEDHNSWLNSGSPRSGTGDIAITSGAPNPFINWPGANFRLANQNADWGAGVPLPSPFNVDMAGTSRPGANGVWDRGAFEYGGGQAPAPPSSLSTAVH
jgi:hypothetical protein